MYIYHWITLQYTWNLYNIVNQLYSKRILKKKITEEKTSVWTGFNADENALFWGKCHKVHALVRKGSELQELRQNEIG